MVSCGMTSSHIVGAGHLVNGIGRDSCDAITISSPGKLNVFLEVRGKRPDGYHELETVMLRISLADQLSVRRNDTGTLSLRLSDATPEAIRAGIPLDGRNLILKAAEAIRLRLHDRVGAEFILHKRIPPESGLGGGSGNAAAALILCRELWNSPLSDGELHKIASSIGSDVNFLLSGHRAAVCRGRGEIIESIPVSRRLHFVAFRPRQGNCTTDVFRETRLPAELRSSADVVRHLEGQGQGRLSPLMFNRLTEAAQRMNPEMTTLMNRLQHIVRRPVFMSGSGSTVFVVAEDSLDAATVLQTVRTLLKRTGWILEC